MPETVSTAVDDRYIHVACQCGREHDLEPSGELSVSVDCLCGATYTASRSPADRHLLLVTT